MTTHVLTVDDLNFTYPGGYQAVHGVSLHVDAGEVYALLGTNGAGKTTTLEVIEGFRAPTVGAVRVFGQDPRDRPKARPRMGIMLQEAGFASDATVAETLSLAGRISGREDDVTGVLEMVELADRAKIQVGQLSGGQRRRLDFACAAWGAPDLLFLDEPTTGLDPAARGRLWETVRRLRDRGSAVILTTHYLEEAERYADRIGLMANGRLVREGTLDRIAADLTSTIRFVAPPRQQPPLPITRTLGELSVVVTRDLQQDLHTLLTWAFDNDFTLHRLEALGGGLEELFTTIADPSEGSIS